MQPEPGIRREAPRPKLKELLPAYYKHRRQVETGLLRMLQRARRFEAPLLLLQLAPSPAAEDRLRDFFQILAVNSRLTDLLWWEDNRIFLLLEECPDEAPVSARLRRYAAKLQLHLEIKPARFPEQGLTLTALLETAA